MLTVFVSFMITLCSATFEVSKTERGTSYASPFCGVSKMASNWTSHFEPKNVGIHLTYCNFGESKAKTDIFLQIPIEGKDGPQSQLKRKNKEVHIDSIRKKCNVINASSVFTILSKNRQCGHSFGSYFEKETLPSHYQHDTVCDSVCDFAWENHGGCKYWPTKWGRPILWNWGEQNFVLVLLLRSAPL